MNFVNRKLQLYPRRAAAEKTVQPFIIREKYAFAVLPRRLCHFRARSTVKVPWAVKTSSGDFKIGIDKPYTAQKKGKKKKKVYKTLKKIQRL